MKKKIIIHLEDLTTAQEVLLQELLQTFCVEQIEVLEDHFPFSKCTFSSRF